MIYNQAGKGYSVWYYSNEALGSIQECECKGVGFAKATEWFKHHITNVSAQMGWTKRVIIVDGDDCIVAEWKHGQGIVWPEHKEDKP